MTAKPHPIQALRARHDLSLRDLGRLTHTAHSLWGHIERGERRARRVYLDLMCRELGEDFEALSADVAAWEQAHR